MGENINNRKELLAELLKWRDRDVIKVITGIRRSGKSVVLRMARQTIIQSFS